MYRMMTIVLCSTWLLLGGVAGGTDTAQGQAPKKMTDNSEMPRAGSGLHSCILSFPRPARTNRQLCK